MRGFYALSDWVTLEPCTHAYKRTPDDFWGMCSDSNRSARVRSRVLLRCLETFPVLSPNRASGTAAPRQFRSRASQPSKLWGREGLQPCLLQQTMHWWPLRGALFPRSIIVRVVEVLGMGPCWDEYTYLWCYGQSHSHSLT